MEVRMKRDHFQTKRPRRPLVLASAVLVAALCGLLGLRLGIEAQDHESVADPALRPTFHDSVFPGGRPSATPDHALLSASDVDRALPARGPTYGGTQPAAS
jgi:hypothetical protein